jgi:hypothetical protein
MNAPFDFSELCRDAGLILGLEHPTELQTGVTIDGERVCLLHDEGLDDGIYLVMDVDAAPEDDAQPMRALLEVNLELSPDRGESFGVDDQSGRIVFRAFLRNGECTPQAVARQIELYVHLMHELREGPLARG